jgi:hypothetical protein
MSFPDIETLSPAQRVMLGWAVRETAPWRARRLRMRDAKSIFEAMAAAQAPVFRFRIKNGRVEMTEKAGGGDRRLQDLIGRADLYRALLQEAVETWCPGLNTIVGMAVSDKGQHHADVPLFCFQKEQGDDNILLPDVDFLINRFYADGYHRDALAYRDKKIHAAFVGTLTGGQLTAKSVRELAVPRLAAAAHFYQHPDVTFLLPSIAQCDSDETRDMLAALPFCGGAVSDWWEQRTNRFIISMDGNGATCSRVVFALKSNSVLLKYASPHRLYYFDGLSPWRHFIPVFAHDDIANVVALERASPGLFGFVADEGKAFAETYLTRESVIFYTAAVLSLYSDCFLSPRAERERAIAPAVDGAWVVIAHQHMYGDVSGKARDWIGVPFSQHWIEGFSISAPDDPVAPPIRYRARQSDGGVTPWNDAGAFCGTRGKNLALTGLCIDFVPDAARRDARFEARFVDGFATGLVPFGRMCASPGGAKLESFRIELAGG